MKKNFLEFRTNFPYEDAIRFQGLLNQEGYTGLFTFECPETITLGKATQIEEDLLVSQEFLNERGTTVLATDRGGRTTWHGPGQLVGFPIGNLKDLYGDIRAVKRFSDELLMGLAHACAVMGVKSVETRAQMPGLWTNKGKLASVGFMLKDGFLFHGFALNVTQNCVAGMGLINPCGITDCPISYLELEGVRVESMRELAKKIFPYLPMYKAPGAQDAIHADEESYSALVSKVSRSSMAMDYYSSNIAYSVSGEMLEQ